MPVLDYDKNKFKILASIKNLKIKIEDSIEKSKIDLELKSYTKSASREENKEEK
jgi:hypothetical protein